MHSSFVSRLSPLTFILLLILFLGSIVPVATLAQGPTPGPTREQPTPNPSSDPDPDPVTIQAAPSAAELALPDGYTPPSEIADLSSAELSSLDFPNQIQGDIKLDVVISPERIRAGEDLTYTYIVTNTRTTAVSNILILARWTSFKLKNTSNFIQFCKDTNCPPTTTPGNLTVEVASDVAAPSDTEIYYRITSTLNPNQSGNFTVVLSTRSDQYPKTAQAVKRPAGSGQLMISKATPPISEDTASSLIVGPVFVLTKTVSASSQTISVGDTAEFTITVGNATATGDIIGGGIRTDAVPATNVILTDILPVGSEFISADGPAQPITDPKIGPVIWNIPGPINPGASVQVKVRYKKLDVNSECGQILNKTYSVTSDEMPIDTASAGSPRFSIKGAATKATVRPPLIVSVPTITPSSPIFGTEATVTIQVQSYWPQAISGVELRYSIQPNAWYVSGGATPAPSSAPDGSSMGGVVTWRFDMPAGSVNTSVSKNFTLVLRGDYSTGGTGIATVTVPTSVPSACIIPVNKGVSFQQRIKASKLAGPDEVKDSTGKYFVRRNDRFTYLIQLENIGVTDAKDVLVTDVLPSALGANFSYVIGTSRLDGQAYEPDPLDIVDGQGGSVSWRGITVPAGKTVELQFDLKVDGNEFIDYCNQLQVTPPNTEPVKYGTRSVCVRINPAFNLTKTADRTTIDGNNPSDTNEVIFTLSMINQDVQSYDVALYDLGGNFEYVRMVSGAAPTQVGTARTYEWPRVTLAPNQRYEVTYVAKLVPSKCAIANYNNDLNFRFWPSNGGSSFVVTSVPRARATVQYLCGSDTNLISYSKTVDAPIISLQDRHLYTITVKNENPVGGEARTNVEIVDVLPSGFTYAGMGVSSKITDQPTVTTRSDGRVALTWTAASIVANTSTNVQFYARSGDIVGTFTNWVRANSVGMSGVKNCSSDVGQSCSGYTRVTEDDVVQIYATRDVKVEALATLEPSIDIVGCAFPGDARVYKISLVNTNRHAYNSIEMTATLPLGLHFQGVQNNTPAPTILSQDENGTVLHWNNLTIPQKPSNAAAAQVSLELQLKAGQTWGPMQPKVEVSSPDGALPMKDGIFDPEVSVCVPYINQPAIGLDTTTSILQNGDEFAYIITLMNPGNTPVTVTIENIIDSRLTYIVTTQGPQPSVNNRTLTWSNVEIPVVANWLPGVLRIAFIVKVTGAAVNDIIPSTVNVTRSSTVIDTGQASHLVKVVDGQVIPTGYKAYLPLIRR